MLGEKYLTEKWSSYKWYIGFQHTIVQGVRALEFLKQEVDAGIKPQTNHFWGQEFADKKFAVMLEGSWLLSTLPRSNFTQNVGMLPMFPVPNATDKTATMMGGWILSILKHLQIRTFHRITYNNARTRRAISYVAAEAYLPTQKPIGEGPYASQLNTTIPYYKEMISMIPVGHSRPNIPEYPQIAENKNRQ